MLFSSIIFLFIYTFSVVFWIFLRIRRISLILFIYLEKNLLFSKGKHSRLIPFIRFILFKILCHFEKMYCKTLFEMFFDVSLEILWRVSKKNCWNNVIFNSFFIISPFLRYPGSSSILGNIGNWNISILANIG